MDCLYCQMSKKGIFCKRVFNVGWNGGSMTVEELIKCCEKDGDEIKEKLAIISQDEKIKLKAKLKQLIVNEDRWNIWIFVSSSIFTILTLIITLATLHITAEGLPDKEWKKWVLNDSHWVLMVVVAIWVAIVFICCNRLSNKSKNVRALSYLEEYYTAHKEVTNINENIDVEIFEDITQRHQEEYQNMLEAWKQKQMYATRQIQLYEKRIENIEKENLE